MLLAIAGKFPVSVALLCACCCVLSDCNLLQGDYTDGRFEEPEGNLDANLGRMPLIQVGSHYVGQSAAINFFIASENGLMGRNHLEAAQIISIAEHVKELQTSYRTIVAWGVEPTEEHLIKWFESGSSDVSGVAIEDGQGTRYLKWYMGRIENVLGTNGFAVGDRLSLADVVLYYAFGEHLKEGEAREGLGASRKYPFGSKERMDAALATHPRIKASVDSVASNANFQKWLSIRGVQDF